MALRPNLARLDGEPSPRHPGRRLNARLVIVARLPLRPGRAPAGRPERLGCHGFSVSRSPASSEEAGQSGPASSASSRAGRIEERGLLGRPMPSKAASSPAKDGGGSAIRPPISHGQRDSARAFSSRRWNGKAPLPLGDQHRVPATFGKGALTVECHLLDFHRDIYASRPPDVPAQAPGERSSQREALAAPHRRRRSRPGPISEKATVI